MSYKSSTILPSSKKTHSEKHKQILKQLLKESANKTCVDCKTAAHPRWASWSLGCFMCIRCSGIHRSMGTHISKVKSVDLDAWTDEQIESMVKWGNEKCNLYWEAKLPAGYVPDQSKIENFIRTKYDLKKWVSSSHIPDPLTIKTSGSTHRSASGSHSHHQASKSKVNDNIDLLANSNTEQVKQQSSLLDDDFGSFTSSPLSTPTAKQSPAPGSRSPQKDSPLPKLPIQQLQSAQSTGGTLNNSNKSGRPDLKRSILSLYSSQSSSTSSFAQPQQRVQPQVQNMQLDTLSSSLNGLQFNNSPTTIISNSNSSSVNSFNSAPSIKSLPLSSQTQPKQASQTTAASNLYNEWSGSSAANSSQWSSTKVNITTNNSALFNTSDLDDDLFKNVWK